MQVDLIEKQYLGDGYVHLFKNNKTEELVYIPTSKEDYERLGLPGGAQFNPVMDGHTWLYSLGGTIKVDNADGMLKDGEYCVTEKEAFIKYEGKVASVQPSQIVDGKIEVTAANLENV